MNDQVTVSWQGMDQLISLSRDQYLNLSEASGFMCSGQLANVGAFSGFLSIFRGTYQDCLDTVTESLNQAMDGAKELSDRIGSVRDDLRRTDHGVSELHTRLTARVECQGYVPGPGSDGIPQLPDNLVHLNSALGIDTPMNGPEVPFFEPGSTASPLDLVDNTGSLVEDASSMGEGLDHADEADDYIEEHGR